MMQDDLTDCPSGVWVELDVTPDVKYGGKYSAQSFADDLNTVTIWVFDQNGSYIDKYTSTGEVLKMNNNTMNLPIGAGKYRIVVWTGAGDINYEMSDMKAGVSTIDDLKVRVARDQNNRQGKKLSSLWHGIEDVEVKESEYVYLPVKLTKDTNTIITVLHDTSGNSLDSDDYVFEIVSDNGYMDYKNQLLSDAQITYDAYLVETALLSDGDVSGGTGETKLSVARAELNTLRLMADKNTRFIVRNKEAGRKILDINLTEYLLLTREFYTGSNGKTMSPQAYLDYEDLFRIIFFLVPNPNPTEDSPVYLCTQLSINGWIVRINNAEF